MKEKSRVIYPMNEILGSMLYYLIEMGIKPLMFVVNIIYLNLLFLDGIENLMVLKNH